MKAGSQNLYDDGWRSPARWSPSSGDRGDAAQNVTWPDHAHLARVEADLAAKPPLVFAGEAPASSVTSNSSPTQVVPLAGRGLRGVL